MTEEQRARLDMEIESYVDARVFEAEMRILSETEAVQKFASSVSESREEDLRRLLNSFELAWEPVPVGFGG